MANNLQRKAFSYTSCTDLYGSKKSDPNSSIRLCVCTKYTKLGGPIVSCTPGVRLPDRSRIFTRPWQTICSERPFRTPPVQICTAPQNRTGTAHLRYLYTTCNKLGGPVGPCTTGVRLPDRSRMFTRRFSTMCSEWHFRTPHVWRSTVPRSRTETAHLGYVYTTCTKQGGPVEPCITVV